MEQRIEAAAPVASAATSSRNWSEPLAFVIMAIVLLIKPAGLFGRAS